MYDMSDVILLSGGAYIIIIYHTGSAYCSFIAIYGTVHSNQGHNIDSTE